MDVVMLRIAQCEYTEKPLGDSCPSNGEVLWLVNHIYKQAILTAFGVNT